MRRLWFLLVALVFGLSACDESGMPLQSLSAMNGATRDATGQGIRTLSLLGGDVRVRAPEGYCIDQSASRARSGFVMMAGCAVVAHEVGVMPGLHGLLTVQFGDTGSASVSGNEEALATFFQTPEGATMVSDLAPVAGVDHARNRVFLRLSSGASTDIEGTTDPVWRGFMDVKGRLVTVTVRSFSHAPLRREQARRLLAMTMTEVEHANTPSTITASN